MNKKFIAIPVIGVVILIFVLFTTQNLLPSDETDLTLTGTPADNFSEELRSKFCGTGDALSNDYVKEFKIPTICTLPQAIITDPDGNIWFIESNTGNLAKFDPALESFTEYENRFWPKSEQSMMWGLDYAPDGTIWFTEEKYKSVWTFNIQKEEYQRFPFESAEENSSPQRLKIHGSQLIINDFQGNKIVFADYLRYGEVVSEFTSPNDISYSYSIPSNNPEAVTADFTIDGKDLWYTNWVLDGPGVLTKINQTEFELSIQNDEEGISADFFILPPDLNTPNGITADNDGNIWMVDSSSSLFFKFNPINQNFTQYVTPNPQKSTYGNYTGEIKSPVSRPYWIDKDSSGNLIFNEQGGNRIAVFNPNSESLVEYSIPSKNPYWGDCENNQDCGTAQIIDFVIKGDQIWFTEWAENNLGVVDTTIPLPFEMLLGENEVSLQPGESKKLNFTIISNSENQLYATLILSDSSEFLDLQINDSPLELLISDSDSINVTLHADEELTPGEYKVLLGAGTEQVSVGKFVTVVVDSPTMLPSESILLDEKLDR